MHLPGHSVGLRFDSCALSAAERLMPLAHGLSGVLAFRMVDAFSRKLRHASSIAVDARFKVQTFRNVLLRAATGRGYCSPEGSRALHDSSQELLAQWKFPAAAALYRRAIALHLVSFHADLAWLLMWGRGGVSEDKQAAFRIAVEGMRLRCADCRGVVALCWACGAGCSKDIPRAGLLARESCLAGSKYGQYACGVLHLEAGDDCRAASFFQQAAEQRLDAAQWGLGHLYENGMGTPCNFATALHWHQLAAAQGLGWACAAVGQMYSCGRGVAADAGLAAHWFMLAVDAGHFASLAALRRLRSDWKR
jgi:TPR repeat protein